MKDQIDNGSRLTAARQARTLTQHELARAAGISQPYLHQLEQGLREGSLTTWRKLADALEIPLSTLLQ